MPFLALRERNVVDVRGFPLGAFKATNLGTVISTYDHDDYKEWDHDDFVIDALLTTRILVQFIGQIVALTCVLIVLSYWRTRAGFLRHAFVTNGLLMAVGFLLVGYQVSGYFLGA